MTHEHHHGGITGNHADRAQEVLHPVGLLLVGEAEPRVFDRCRLVALCIDLHEGVDRKVDLLALLLHPGPEARGRQALSDQSE